MNWGSVVASWNKMRRTVTMSSHVACHNVVTYYMSHVTCCMSQCCHILHLTMLSHTASHNLVTYYMSHVTCHIVTSSWSPPHPEGEAEDLWQLRPSNKTRELHIILFMSELDSTTNVITQNEKFFNPPCYHNWPIETQRLIKISRCRVLSKKS